MVGFPAVQVRDALILSGEPGVTEQILASATRRTEAPHLGGEVLGERVDLNLGVRLALLVRLGTRKCLLKQDA